MFDEAPAVLAVITARYVADIGAPDYTLSDLRDEWRLSDFDLATDAVVAEAPDGKIAGYAIVRRPGTLAVVARSTKARDRREAAALERAARTRAGTSALPAVDRRQQRTRS